MTTYESIKNRINAYSDDADLQGTHLELMNAFNLLSSAEFDEIEINDIVFTEYDALESREVDEDSAIWQEIRDLQHDMVTLFVGINS